MRLMVKSAFRVTSLILLISGSPILLRAAEVPDHVRGRLVVGHRRDADRSATDRTLRSQRAYVRMELPELAATVVEIPEEESEAIEQSLRSSGLFTFVERDYYAHTGATPNDPSYPSQWHLAKIQAPQAWNTTVGSASVVVAVIDSGVNPTQPDLGTKLLPGWNFVANNANTADVLGHGTAVAGTIAAATNNGIGIAGVSWSSMILPLVTVDANDYASYSNIAAAIQYAADHGARIINVSLGGSSPSAVLQNAVTYAWNKGSVVFAAAMNNSSSTPYYPAACTNVVAVSSTDNNDNLASFSNFGNWITLAAPGVNILTTQAGGSYGYWYGTSFSAPIVAGVAALALAVNSGLGAAGLVSLLEQSADDLGAPGYDTSFGWGRVNAYKAVTGAQKTPAPATISISPQTVSLSAGQTQQFQATVTGATNATVTWSLSSAVGTLANGLYTAPATISATQTLTVKASLAGGASASAAITLTPPAAPPPSPSFQPVRVNAGGAKYTDSAGNIWNADTGYIGGNTASTGSAVSGTTASALYQTCRWGGFSYQFAVPNGAYTVNLKFAEIYFTSPGQRVFNVALNGAAALTNFDIVGQAGGTLKAIDKSFQVSVTNGLIAVQFTPGAADQPLVNAIEILASGTPSSAPPVAPPPVAPPPVSLFRVDAGGGVYTDPSGNLWSADGYFIGGNTASTGSAVSGTTASALYQTCRWGSFSYQFAVPNGTYTVNLKFAEIYFSSPGQRVFNVALNGAAALTNFDIVGQAGGTLKAIDKSFQVSVTNGLITIQFTPGAADQPLVNAIEILSSGT